MEADLAQLLAQGERAAFHGPPPKAVEALEVAVERAQQAKRVAESTAASWLLGLSLGAAGRYARALDVLAPLVDLAEAKGTAPEVRLFGGFAAASVASVQRQLGRHGVAQQSDERGLALADGKGEAAFACQLGLAADAVGLGDAATATSAADKAAALLPDRPTEWWRQRVRYDWVRTELALLAEDPESAAEAAEAAVERAERARAPRHDAKSLLFLGVARVSVAPTDAASALRRAATLAEGLGALPLIWPSRALLGALLMADNPDDGAASLGAARTAVLAIAADLPDDLRTEWLARPDLAALLEG
ncbi:MAG: hypothetical protein ABR520_01290 [Mycobacteriales bacterium]